MSRRSARIATIKEEPNYTVDSSLLDEDNCISSRVTRQKCGKEKKVIKIESDEFSDDNDNTKNEVVKISKPRKRHNKIKTIVLDDVDSDYAVKIGSDESDDHNAENDDDEVVKKPKTLKKRGHDKIKAKISDSDSDYAVVKKSKSSITKKKKNKYIPVTSPPSSIEKQDKSNGEKKLSDYERQVLQNIEERKKIFEMLQLGEAKEQLVEALKGPAKSAPRGYKRKKDEDNFPKEPQPLRMSLRARNKPAAEVTQGFIETQSGNLLKASPVKRTGPLTLSHAYVDQDAIEDSTKFIEDMIPLLEKEGELEKLPSDLQEFMKLIDSFTLSEKTMAKVCKKRIYSMAWHPGTCKLLLAAGDAVGTIGFWDVEQYDDKNQGVRVYEVHGSPVNCLSFDKFNPTRLFSTSYDGFVRCLDFHTNVFDKVYQSISDSKKVWTAYHAQKDPSTLIVSQCNGQVAVVDLRTKPSPSNKIQCFENSVRTLSLHPMNENLFMACNRYGEMGVFDLRNVEPNEGQEVVEPVISFPQCSKGIHGAFYSPITGKYGLTTSLDHTLKIYDLQDNATNPEDRYLKVIPHNNFTGQWLTPFKSQWHPQREDVFVVGSMEQPRRIEMYGAPTGQLMHNFRSDHLASVCSINVFHPTVPILAGGNSSGRVHIFRPQSSASITL